MLIEKNDPVPPENENELIAGPYYSALIPELIFSYGDRTYKAMKGTHSWTYDKGNGLFETINADSMHPTEAKKHMQELSFRSIKSSTDLTVVFLTFDALLSKVTALAWRRKIGAVQILLTSLLT